MSRTFETHDYVDAPPDRVWQVLRDVARWPEWTPTVTSVDVLEGADMDVGLRAAIRQPRLPRAEWTVTEVVEGVGSTWAFTWEASGPGLRTIARHVVTADGKGAALTLSIEQTGPMSAVASLLWGRLTQRYIETEAESLHRRVTSAPTS